jgi:hypothetical protein
MAAQGRLFFFKEKRMKQIGVMMVAVAFLVIGCSKTQPGGTGSVALREDSPVAGIVWSYPASWTKQHDQPMRVATYVIPAAQGDSSAGECGVFYFGEDQGGDVDANIQRWGSQFEGATQAEKSAMDVAGMKVTVVRIEGTFLAPGGPMMASRGSLPGYKLLGAIVEGPKGMVFFKSTGPAKLIDSAESGFLAMIQSLSVSK